MLRDAEVIQDDAQWLCTKIFVPLLRSSLASSKPRLTGLLAGIYPPGRGARRVFVQSAVGVEILLNGDQGIKTMRGISLRN